LLTHRQTNKQTNKNWQKHNLLGGGNDLHWKTARQFASVGVMYCKNLRAKTVLNCTEMRETEMENIVIYIK